MIRRMDHKMFKSWRNLSFFSVKKIRLRGDINKVVCRGHRQTRLEGVQ